MSLLFMLLLIFGAMQLCWWSASKYLANLAAFGAARTAMVGGPTNEQMTAASQIIRARGRNGPAPQLVPMTRTYGGGGGGGIGGIFSSLYQLFQGAGGLFRSGQDALLRLPGVMFVTLYAQFGSLGGGLLGGLGQNASQMLFNLGLPTNLGNMIMSSFGGLLGGGGGTRRQGIAYVLNADGGLPIQNGVRLVGWSHVVIQPDIPEIGDNAGGAYGGFGGFGNLAGLGSLLGSVGNINQAIGGILQQLGFPPEPGQQAAPR